MKILIIGEPENLNEAKEKFGNDHSYEFSAEILDQKQLTDFDIIFDFIIEEQPEYVEAYSSLDLPVFLNTVKTSLAELNFIYGLSDNIYGFNGLKTFFNRDLVEVTTLKDDDGSLKKIFASLDSKYALVNDRVGMVTPRIVFMIINEAFYTVQEGTATKSDIDLGMKLGTNYPYGPFEWLEKIGINDVYEVLEALYDDTKEERYKIAPLLKKEYLMA